MVLYLNRIVKPILPDKFRLHPRRQRLRFQKALVRAAGRVIFLNLFGTDLHLAFKFHGGHEEVEEGNQVAVDGGKAGLESIPLKAVAADILADNGAVFCSTKQLSFFLWSRERVKGMGQAGLRCQSVRTWLINSLPLSLWNSTRGKVQTIL
jgi:hypothetical protein